MYRGAEKHFVLSRLANAVNSVLAGSQQSQIALHESEEKYRQIVYNAGEAIAVVQDWVTKFANPRAIELWGYASDESASRPPIEFIHPDDREAAIKRHLAVLKGEGLSPVYYTYRFIAKDGDVRWGKTTATRIIWEGKPASLIFLTDVTELKHVEEALGRSEERYRTILDEMEEGYFEVDLAGNYIFVNEAICRQLGYSREELRGKNYRVIFAKDDAKNIYKTFNQVYREGQPIKAASLKIVQKDGSTRVRELSAFPIRNENGEIVGFRGVSRDITERKKAEETLRQSEERYRTVLEDVEKGYYEVDLTGNITFVNDSICRMLGYSSEEVIGTNYRRYAYDEDNARKIYKCTNSVYRKGRPAKWFSWEYAAKNGEKRFIEASIAPRFDGQGEIIGFRGILNDVTERKAMEQQVLLTNKLASIGELASGVAHELNNPLTTVMGYAQLLIESKDVPEHIKSDLDKVYQESQRAAKIVQNLLSFARRRRPEKTFFDINNLVQKTLDLRSYELKVSNISVYVNLKPDIPEIKADYNQIQQIILNILINAEQALAEVKRRGKITVTTGAVKDRIRIRISDNGPGISKSNIDRIFDPFFTTKEVGKGTGLGLSVCLGIVTAHGGNLYVESEKSKGAAFIIELPISVAEEIDAEEEIVVAENSHRHRRKTSYSILIVDDEPGIRDILTRILSEIGYRTEGASDARSALTKIAENGYDLCIIDLKMPRISGRRLYEIIAERHPSAAEKVIFITGDTITPATQKFLDSTERPYLTKPFNPRVVVELVEEILGGNGKGGKHLT